MRGSPIFRALIALCALLSLGWPLHRLLQADEGAAPEPVQQIVEKKRVHLQVSFTEAPVSMRVLSLGEKVWEEAKPAVTAEHDLAMAFPKEGVDLQFELAWPEGTRGAAKVVLTDPDGGEHTEYVWGTGSTSDVLTFQSR